MMTELYIPRVGDVIRLTEDFALTSAGRDSKELRGLHRLAVAHGDANWPRPVNIILPAGTCLIFKLIRMSPVQGNSTVTLAIFAHERLDLTPKMNGGTAFMNSLTFEVAPEKVNGLKYEKVQR